MLPASCQSKVYTLATQKNYKEFKKKKTCPNYHMFARQKRVHYITEEKGRLITGEVKKLINCSMHRKTPDQDSSKISTYRTFHASVSFNLVTQKPTSKQHLLFSLVMGPKAPTSHDTYIAHKSRIYDSQNLPLFEPTCVRMEIFPFFTLGYTIGRPHRIHPSKEFGIFTSK